MKNLCILIFISFVLAGCNNSTSSLDEIVESLVNSEKIMNQKELVVTTATSSSSELINLRIVVEDRITKEQALGKEG